ncbi:MAG: DUF86 domain-containing protein [Victivallales bacterium]|nr:DUF86 domain-containing protein [Victivallales bacterium]
MNKDLDRLQHISEAFELLLRVTDCNYADYQDDRDKQAAVERYFEILGEAAKMVSADMQKAHSEIPWRLAGDMRNFIIHSYVKVSSQRLWETAKNDIPLIFRQIRHLLGVYGEGWIPCTKRMCPPSDAECVESILSCIGKLKKDVLTCMNGTEAGNICLELIEAGRAASQLSRPFRLAHQQIDWHMIIEYGERIVAASENMAPMADISQMAEWMISNEDKLALL